ncbi:MAG: rhamnulokinase family protein [Eubacteriales bacterium]
MQGIKLLGIDIGGGSGRGIIGKFDGGKLSIEEICRFENKPIYKGDALVWDAPMLRREIENAVALGSSMGALSVGIDTWGVDYGLVDKVGNLVCDPYSNRDARTRNIGEYFSRFMPLSRLYEITGIQYLEFNTALQLAAEKKFTPDRLERTYKILFLPDLFGYFLSGEQISEYTIASTGALLDAHTRDFSPEILSALGIPREKFAPIVDPGTVVGKVKPEYANNMKLIAVPSHDTASAVFATPAVSDDFIYISSGTWSLMGCELKAPLICAEGERRNYTNEGGACGTIRYLKNHVGLWLVQECRRAWKAEGKNVTYDSMTEAAMKSKPFVSFIDVNDPVFMPPGDMPTRIAEYCRRTAQPVPETVGEIIRTIFDSLALCYRYTVEDIACLTGKKPSSINIVGGGSKDPLLSQITADVCGMPVIAGPSEATCLGNLLVQAMSHGIISSMGEARELVRASFPVQTYLPRGNKSDYDAYLEKHLRLIGKE